MGKLSNCPKCNSEYTYKDGYIFICPECAYEWSKIENEEENILRKEFTGMHMDWN